MAVAFLIWIMTVATVVLFAGRYFWFPAAITKNAALMDQQFSNTLVVTTIVFVLAQVGLGWAVFRYKDRGRPASYSHGNNKMEVVWTLATTVLFFTLNITGQAVWADLHFTSPGPEALQIEVTGQQFAWNIRYAGPDGKFGQTDPKEMSDSSGNPLGLVDSDPAGRDDIVAPTMAVPVNRPVQLMIKSKDVTHSFFVRELRFKQDAVPGMAIPVHFTATQIGKYEIVCAELCGLAHYKMKSYLEVLSDADFEKWIKERTQ